jgi:hypothetical protein
MLRTLFITAMAATAALASSLATAAGSEGLKRPLRTAADSSVHVTQPPLTVAHENSCAKHSFAA